MINFKYAAAPLVIGALALTGCPGDDTGDTTGANDDTTGNPVDTTTGVDTTPTPPGDDTTTENPVDTDDPPATTTATEGDTEEPPMCDPACGDNECCVEGLCFDAPEPNCEAECAEGETCACPEGSDPCDCTAECIPDEGPCPAGWGEGNYDSCADASGAADVTLCAEGSICVQDADPPTITVCAAQECTEACDCPEPPDTGDATVTCADITDDMMNDCYLSCEMDETCPAGMNCVAGFLCASPVPQPDPGGFLNCSLTGFNCPGDQGCLQDGDGMMVPATWSVCAETLCTTVDDCSFAAPATGDAVVACADPTGMGGDNACYLDCSAKGSACPDGMECIDDSWCAWPAGDTQFFDNFQTASFGAGWTLIDVDGQPAAEAVNFINDAWVVTDAFYAGAGTNYAAYSNSWYDPAGAADDWLISPPIMIGPNAQLQWRARAQDPAFPDGYEVRISTAGPDIADFEANDALFTIPAENAGADYTFRTVNLSDEGYADQTVYLAWRNNSSDQFVLLVDDVAVVDFPPAP
ncbi:MAG: choice-of-anchor J domain-containing protein [Myxococcota bacterium]